MITSSYVTFTLFRFNNRRFLINENRSGVFLIFNRDFVTKIKKENIPASGQIIPANESHTKSKREKKAGK